jgi:hypothetical protein
MLCAIMYRDSHGRSSACVATREKSDSEVNVDSKDLKQKLTSIENYKRLG